MEWRQKLSSIRVQDLLVMELPTPSRKHKCRCSHIGLTSRTADHTGHSHLFQLRLLIGSRSIYRYFSWECARRRNVDANSRLRKGRGKHGVQMQESDFRRGIGDMAVGAVFEQRRVAACVDSMVDP